MCLKVFRFLQYFYICVGLLSCNAKEDRCFCHLSGQVDDCFCDIETLEQFNNEKVYPLIQDIILKDYFRYYKVNLFKPCKFFDGDVGLCENEACSVKICPEEDLPKGMRNENFNKNCHEKGTLTICDSKKMDLGDVNGTLSNITKDFLSQWDVHDNTIHRFCDLDDETSADLQYVDLVNNPERYTGYKGPMAWRIWKSIYEENCFLPEDSNKKKNVMYAPFSQGENILQVTNGDLQGMCLEKRVFYRVISGLHTSINTHLSMEYLFEDGWGEKKWGPNLQEFQRRFDPSITKGEGTARLKNLYFIFLLELRALSKLYLYFKQENIFLFTGRLKEDKDMKQMLIKLLEVTNNFPMHFDEGVMFKDENAKSLKIEFAQRFLNVTRIIDCVTCEKCRLWGKLQTQGLGTALKILFSGEEISGIDNPPFKLLRQEVVSLVNAFARLSESIKSLEKFRELILLQQRSHSKEEL
ncbi:ERO1-like protein beta [Clavelina lepadiformis]|uniref:ERO1-like protein beta n=1 Tax=Clavelina lepadiformis TaxID=159417 RepID=UPI0040428EBA